MYLHIAPSRMINEIQQEFNSFFPFLKIEFFQKHSQPGFALKKLISHNRKVGELQLGVVTGEMEIKENMKVSEMEKKFKDQFGLAVQVFRRSGNLWLETTMTDNWTLGQQNEHGKEISAVGNTRSRWNDYDLNRDADH